MLKGTARLNSHFNSIEIKEGDVFYIPKELLYQSRWYGNADNEIEFYSLGFKVFPKEDSINYMLQKIELNRETEILLDKITQNLLVNCENIGYLYTFMGLVSKNMEISINDKSEANLRKAIAFMRNNLNVNVRDIAKYMGMSESGIYAMFKRSLNKTPIEIKHKILIDKACELLVTTDKSVEEISDMLCFSSSSYFRKIMKAQINKSPKEVRSNINF
jgi:AraC-like DNA-binding protein